MSNGTPGEDRLVGSSGNNVFNIEQGGDDTVLGRGGNDTINAGGALTGADVIDGGAGSDLIAFDGDYSGGVVLDQVTSIERLTFAAGHDYDLVLAGWSGDGAWFDVVAWDLETEDSLRLDASAIDSDCVIEAGRGDDHILTGAGRDHIGGNGGGDTIDGGGGDDTIDIDGLSGSVAGVAHLSGGAGDDAITFSSNGSAASFQQNDRVDGGEGHDILAIDELDGPLVFNGANSSSVEEIHVGSGDVDITLARSAGGDGIDADGLRIWTEYFARFDVDARRARISLFIEDTAADNLFRGGKGADEIYLVEGLDTVSGGAGDDLIAYRGGVFEAGDQIDGGGGADQLQIGFVEPAQVVCAADTIRDIETMILLTSARIVFHEANVTVGATMQVSAAASVNFMDRFVLDASAETNGRFAMRGGLANDVLIGGAGADTLEGAEGADSLTGGAGADRFVYRTVNPQDGSWDLIRDLEGQDIIDLKAIDANVASDKDNAFVLVDAFSHHAGEAVLSYNANQNITVLSLDVDGDGFADLRVRLAGEHEDFDNFVL